MYRPTQHRLSSSSPNRAVYQAGGGVRVENFYDDVTVGMSNTPSRDNWEAGCYRTLTNSLIVRIEDKMGQFTIDYPIPACPADWLEDGDGCMGSNGPVADPNGGGGGGGGGWQPPPYTCEWYEYTYYNWSGGTWTALYRWYECEY